ncbi:class I SAM-dependent methyltransferase [Plantactinospora siamensis]|uniref:Class I SAM-dependent methyltransferase n=1 Tax=Plantactinospora siamensis TaxID=555372 RepID=A0ABV6NSI0_9ACTN
MTPRPQRSDYDDDPARFRINREATRRFVRGGDVHVEVADRLAAEGRNALDGRVAGGRVAGPVLDIGGNDGMLARLLAVRGVPAVVLDRAVSVARAPCPAVRADADRLPFPDASFAGAAALWMLYHLAEPVRAITEARRVLRPGGLFVACTPSRYNDPELRDVLPGWGQPGTFDAEEAAEMVAGVFGEVEVLRWDELLVRLPDRSAIALFLRGRGLTDTAACEAAGRLPTPLEVTKRGLLAWARRH